ncbi:ABC transporter permease [Saccharopolyspora rosea]|uniref:ABC transporter permease n=1 Tax=Saccharopolyspora rosea TaxID=524884 RepID=UPI0021D991BD|nr:ABC transporter permease subunit [Saccharopolyspora rosea]
MTLVAATGSRRVLRRLLRHRTGVVGLVLAAALVLVALAAPLLAPADPAAVDFDHVLGQPSPTALLGTDELGRDQLSRVFFGVRASVFVGVVSVLLALVVAVPLGLVAGYYRGAVDAVVSRVTDTLLAFPFLVLAVGLAAVLGASMLNAAIAIGVSQVPNLIRVVRGEALRLATEEYVAASVAAGRAAAPCCSGTSCRTRSTPCWCRSPSRSRRRSSARRCCPSWDWACNPRHRRWA